MQGYKAVMQHLTTDAYEGCLLHMQSYVIIFSTQKFMTHTEWKGMSAHSLDEYIQESEIDPATCPTACLKDVSKICTTANETLTVFFKCPTWENETLFCQQALEGKFFNLMSDPRI